MEDALSWIGAPAELVRVLDSVYLDQARHSFASYVYQTLAASQRHGGRFNPRGEFGALYTATDEGTAWAEVAARFRREGIDGLPPDMGVIRLVARAGRYADLTTDAGCVAWGVQLTDLVEPDTGREQREKCCELARAVRVLGDALVVPSTRAGGNNVPLYPDRLNSELEIELQMAEPRPVPEEFAQRASESW